MMASMILLGIPISSAYGILIDQVQITQRPDIEYLDINKIPKLDYENGYLKWSKQSDDSKYDLQKDEKKILQKTINQSFKVTENGCYRIIEYTNSEHNKFSAIASNTVCKNGSDITINKPKQYKDNRIIIETDINGPLKIVIFPTHEDLKYLSGCPDTWPDSFACFREVDGNRYIVMSWEKMSSMVLWHEIKHAMCDCDFHA